MISPEMKDESSMLKVVCFGDSLTLGYQSPTSLSPFVENIPYATYLQEWLGERGTLLVQGVCGETTQDMQLRFREDVLNHQPQIAIILGGTNDLGCGIKLDIILGNLISFFEQLLAQKILPVAVTVPSLRDNFGQDEEFNPGRSGKEISDEVAQAIALRIQLNQSIREYSCQHNFPAVDWFAVTTEVGTQALSRGYSNDGLHLNTMGYRKLAELIWKEVFDDLLKKKPY